MMEKQVTLYDNHDNWKVILIDEKKVVLYNKFDGVVDVVKKPVRYNERIVQCPMCHRDMPATSPQPTSPLNDPNTNAGINPTAPSYASPNYFQLLWNATCDDEESGGASGPGLNAGYYRRFFQEVKKIGSGGFGSVYMCRHVINGIDLGEYAIKKVPMGSNVAWQQRVLAEVQNLQVLQKHANIIGYKHSWIEQDQPAHFGPPVPCLFILMEYANVGNLEDYIRKHYLADHQIWRFFVDLCKGLGYLHHCGILHRDIKCNNILLRSDYDAVTGDQEIRLLISDFGTSSNILTGTPIKRTGNTGTVEYLAPELINVNTAGEYEQYTEKCDLWALGVILYQLCFAQFPFPSANAANREIPEVLREIAAFEGIILPRNDRDPQLISLILELLNRNPIFRPSIAEILQRPHVQAKIYAAPSHSSTSSHARPASPRSPPVISPGIRLRRSNTPTYLLTDSSSQLKTKPQRRPSPPPKQATNLTTNKLLQILSPFLARLSSSTYSIPLPTLFSIACLVHLWLCFRMYEPSPPPLTLILPLVAVFMVGIRFKREVARRKLAPIFVLQFLWQLFVYEQTHSMYSRGHYFYPILLTGLCILHIFL